MNGLDTELDDRPLHISVRFKINTVVRNIFHHSCWDTEERSGCFPFTMGKDFTMVIKVERSAYQVRTIFFAILNIIVTVKNQNLVWVSLVIFYEIVLPIIVAKIKQ